jgi:hypothetical protein
MFYASPEEVENNVNAFLRRCRIGKVTRKPINDVHDGYRPDSDGVWRKVIGIQRQPAQPVEWWKQPHPIYDDILSSGNRKCSCPPGSACGNVACPYRLGATC